MTDWHKDPVRAWAENWARVGPQLDAIRRRELEAMTDAERFAMIDDLLDIAFRFARPRTTSGLVEQQRWFQKMRREFGKE